MPTIRTQQIKTLEGQAENDLLYCSSATALGKISGLANAVLVTSEGKIPSMALTLPNAVQDNITRLGTVTSAGPITSNGPLTILRPSTANQEPTLGAELLVSDGWTSTGWTGDFATGWTHTPGNVLELVAPTGPFAVNPLLVYEITYTITGRNSGSVTFNFGWDYPLKSVTSSGNWRAGLYDVIDGCPLRILPTSDFDGKIVLSVKGWIPNDVPTASIGSVIRSDQSGGYGLQIRDNHAWNAIFIGPNAGLYQPSYETEAGGGRTVGIGADVLKYNSTGSYNTAIGGWSLVNNTTGHYGTAQGYFALGSNKSGHYNTGIGALSLGCSVYGSENTAVGHQSLNNLGLNYDTTDGGSYNTAIGSRAGNYITGGVVENATASYSTFVGALTRALADGGSNETVIGYGATGAGSNSVTLGNTSVTKTILNGNVGIGTTAPTSKLTVSNNTATLPAPPTGTVLHLGQVDGGTGRILLDVFNNVTSGSPAFQGRNTSGTAAAPSAVTSGVILAQLGGIGYGATGYATSSAARVVMCAAETWTDATQASYMSFWTNPVNTVSAGGAERMRIDASGNVGIGTNTPGIGGTSSARNYLTVSGSTSCGVLELVTGQADGDLIILGQLVWSDKNSTLGDKRRSLISSQLSGTTANQRGSLMTFWTAPDAGGFAERMRIDASGYLGIGTTAPLSPLSVNGNTDLGNSNGNRAAGGTTTRISAASVTDAGTNYYGSYGKLIFHADTAYTAAARRYLLTNAYNLSSFAVIRSVDSTTDPALGNVGAVSSGTADFFIDNTGMTTVAGIFKIGASTTKTWSNLFDVMQFGGYSAFMSHKSSTSNYMMANAYYDGAWKYNITTATGASVLTMQAGSATIRTTGSGDADGAITWKTPLTCYSSGETELLGLWIVNTAPVVRLSSAANGDGTVSFYDTAAAATTAQIAASHNAGNDYIGITRYGATTDNIILGAGGLTVGIGTYTTALVVNTSGNTVLGGTLSATVGVFAHGTGYIDQLTLSDSNWVTKSRIGSAYLRTYITNNALFTGSWAQDSASYASWVVSVGGAADDFTIDRSPAGSTTLVNRFLLSSAGAATFAGGVTGTAGIFTSYVLTPIIIHRVGGTAAANLRWQTGPDGAESTGNAGSNYTIYRYADDGSYLGSPLIITRSTGAATFASSISAGAITSSGLITGNLGIVVQGAYSVLGRWNSGTRPASSADGGVAVGWNYSQNNAETSMWNLYDSAPVAFSFKQKTGASTHVDLLTISGTGAATFASSISAGGDITSTGTYGWAIGNTASVPRISYTSGTTLFSLLTAANGYASIAALNATIGGTLIVTSSGTDANRYTTYWNSSTKELVFVSSDERLKKDFDFNVDGLAIVNKLKPLYFTYIASDERQLGFTAQNAKSADQHLAWHDTISDRWGLKGFDGFAAISVRAIQQLDMRTHDTDTRLTQLEARNASLEAEVAALKAKAA